MAEAVVSSVVQRLGELLISEAKFLHEVSGNVKRIKTELKRMQCLLKDADSRQDESESLRNYVAEIRALAYRAEDVVQCYAAEVESRRGSGIQKTLKRMAGFPKEAIALHKLGKEMEDIRRDVADLTGSLQTYGINRQAAESSSSENLRWQRLSHPEHVEQDFIGMEDDIKILVSSLVDKDKQRVRAVSIWGMGGLGKTTLAQKVYKHSDVQRWFDAFAWVCVTQKHETRKILQDVLKGLSSEKKDRIAEMTDGELMEELYRVQTQKKCLVVLDDIWSADAWDSMRRAFPTENCSGSKILLTTRIRDVAVHVDPDVFHHQLQLLDDEQSWELLKKKVFTKNDGSDTSTSEEKEEFGRKMVKQCQGLPLAIAVLGGLLKREDWDVVNQNIMMHLRKGNSFGKQYGELPQVLALSYNELPYQLKPCFLYLGGFPEDSKIQAKKLYQMWIAEGLVLSRDIRAGETMMDVAERYLGELAQRNMVQVQLEEWLAIGEFKSCCLHDLMRDLCVIKAREENFLELMDDLNQNQNEHGPNLLTRLAIHLTLKNVDRYVALPKETTLHLRALLLHLSRDCEDKIAEITTQFCKSRSLKVLAIENSFFETSPQQFPEAISKLVHLRYFSFQGKFRELPSSIGKLRHLQTLNLEGCAFDNVLGENILKNTGQLKHLYLPVSQIQKNRRTYQGKLRFDGLGNLETLVNFNTSWYEAKDLIKLTNLRELEALVEYNLDDLEEITKYVNSSKNLKQFRLIIGLSSEERCSDLVGQLLGSASLSSLKAVNGKLKLPKHVGDQCLSPSLVQIRLLGTQLEEGSIAVLERFPNLRILHFWEDSYVEKAMVCSATGFPQLREFWLETMTLETWTIEEGAMPNLSELIIDGCGKLEMLPDGLRCIASLQLLEIVNMPDEFKRRVKVVDGQEGDDFDKIKHVPTIKFKQR